MRLVYAETIDLANFLKIADIMLFPPIDFVDIYYFKQ